MQGNNNNATIPNVSCVFRQLVQLSHINPRLNSSQQSQNNMQKNTYSNFSNKQLQNKQNFDFVSNMGLDDRQQRHQQLMNRLKNSVQQNRQLLGVNQTPKQKYQYQSATNNNTKQFNSYNPYSSNNNNQSYSNNNNLKNVQSKNQPKRWNVPQIKYRHIQDLQQQKMTLPKNVQIQNQTSSQHDFINVSQTQSKLQKEFYQNHSIDENKKLKTDKNLSNKSTQNNNQNYKPNKTQQDQYEQNSIDQQMANKFSKFSNQPSKYNQNLESYYQLCRKQIKGSTIANKQSTKQSNKINEQKFIRKTQQKVTGINLSKAIQILSLDD